MDPTKTRSESSVHRHYCPGLELCGGKECLRGSSTFIPLRLMIGVLKQLTSTSPWGLPIKRETLPL